MSAQTLFGKWPIDHFIGSYGLKDVAALFASGSLSPRHETDRDRHNKVEHES